MAHTTISLGSEGDEVKVAQQALLDRGYSVGPEGVDGKFGHATEHAVRQYQIDRTTDPPPPPHPLALNWPLHVDGIVGPYTWGRLDPPLIKKNSPDYAHVRLLQALLKRFGPAFDPGPIDGSFGNNTEHAVKAFQKWAHLTVDGEVGHKTWIALRS
jgi:peptidoglycan L-alanyl-D-glutamate endopeptidase CwlK